MTRRRRILVASGLAAAALAAALLLEFNAPRMGQAALARMGATLGARVTARDFRFRLVRGLALEGLDASSDYSGGRWSLGADALVLDHRLWPLLTGRVEVERIVLRRPRIRLEQRAAGRPPVPVAAAAPAGAALALRVVEARMDDGTIEVVAPGQPVLTVSGLDVSLQDLAMTGSTLPGLSANGRAKAKAIRFGRTSTADVDGRFRLEKGTLAAEQVRFRTDQGRFEATVRARLDRLPLTYSLELRGDPLDLNRMAGAAQGGFGPATLHLSAAGAGAGAAALRGRGVLKMQPGRLPSSPLLQRLESALGARGLVGARYEGTETPFRLEGGRALFDAFQLRAGPLAVDMRGWISLDGPLALAVRVRAPRSMVRIAGVSAGVLDTLTDEEGRVTVPLTVTGTQENPLVRPDAGALAAQAGRGAGRAAVGKAVEELKGLLRRP